MKTPLNALLGALLLTLAAPGALDGIATQAQAGEETPDKSGYSVYTLDVSFDPDRNLIAGKETVDYLNRSGQPIDDVYFLLPANYGKERNPHLDLSHIDALYPNGFDPSWTRVEEVTDVSGNPLSYRLERGPDFFQTYSLDEALLRVKLPEPLAAGKRVTLALRFATKFPLTLRGDEARYQGVYTWRYGWNPVAIPADQLIDGRYISSERPYYPYVLPAALYELTLTLPQGYRVAMGADHEEQISEADGNRTIHAINAKPVRSIPLSLSQDFRVYRFPHPEVEMEVYSLPGHEDAARLIASYAAESLDYFRERWGEYPHRRLVITETPSVNAAFSGASADAFLVLNRSWFSEKDLALHGFANRLLDYLIAHEVAHQWWGIGIGADLNAENFLSEAFSQYFSITYFEEKYGEFGPNLFQFEREGLMERFAESQFGYINLREHLQGELPYMMTFRNRFDEAIIKPRKDVKFSQASSVRIYNKGYLMLRALRGVIGPETMNALLKEAHAQYLNRVVTTEELEALAEKVSNQELDRLFQSALHEGTIEEGHAPYVDYGIERVDSSKRRNGTYEHRVHLTREGPLRLPVQVRIGTRAGGEQTESWEIEDQAGPEHVMTVETPGPLDEVEVDPEHMTPDTNRLNNSYVLDGLSLWNRRVKFIPTGENAYPLGAYLIRVNPIEQVLEGGYLPDHRWRLGNRFAAFVKDLGRGSAVGGIAGLVDHGLIGELAWQETYFAHPETGLQGQYWEPADQLQLRITRRPDTTARPSLDEKLGATGRMATVLGLNWTHQESIGRRQAWWATVQNDPQAFTRVEVGVGQRFRVAPGVDTGVRFSFGWGEGQLGIYHFTLAELVSHQRSAEFPYPGDAKVLGQLDVSMPFTRGLSYNLLNVAMLHRIDELLYLRLGGTWEEPSRLSHAQLRDLELEVGAEFTFRGHTLGGLFPWDITLGFAYPLTLDEGAAQIHQYLRISTPLF